MRWLFHGTTRSGHTRIINGLPKVPMKHVPSNPKRMYFVNADDFMLDDGTVEYVAVLDEAFRYALMQSCRSEDTEILVLECMVPDELVSDDTSFDGTFGKQIDVGKWNIEMVICTHLQEVSARRKERCDLGYTDLPTVTYRVLDKDLKEYINNCKCVS